MLTKEQVEEQLQIIEDNAWWIGNGQDKPELIPDEIWKIKENHIGDARQVILSHIDHLQAKLKEVQEAAGPLNNKLEQYKLLPDESIMMLKIGDLRRLAEVSAKEGE